MASSRIRPIAFTALLSCLALVPVFALGLSDLTNQDAARGIKGALTQGASSAIAKLGVPGGFLDNPKVRIPLPPALDEVAKGLRLMWGSAVRRQIRRIRKARQIAGAAGHLLALERELEALRLYVRGANRECWRLKREIGE